MEATLRVIHILLGIGLILAVIVQRSSSDGGGIMGGGGASNLGGLMSVRGTANLLTRITAILAGAFIVTSIILTILAGGHASSRSIADQIAPAAQQQQESTDAAKPPAEAPQAPAQTPAPSVPVSQ